jgi:putative polyhydroxyalkanoate system protein
MSKIELEIPHKLSQAEAKSRISGATSGLEKDFGAKCQWDQHENLRVTRKGLMAILSIFEDRVKVDMELGLFLRPMASSIRKGIEKRLNEILV